jgi:catechol 2,3-dioxygenase-like lactoylglutathione lyase family enzyme
VARVHHSAVCTTDVDASLRFWRDGLGFAVLMDHRFEGDWRHLFGASTNTLRSIFLGDPEDADAGIVELVEFDASGPAAPDRDGPRVGFFLLSVFTPLDRTLDRLHAQGFAVDREICVSDVRMAVARDPNGVLVELIDRDVMP